MLRSQSSMWACLDHGVGPGSVEEEKKLIATTQWSDHTRAHHGCCPRLGGLEPFGTSSTEEVGFEDRARSRQGRGEPSILSTMSPSC